MVRLYNHMPSSESKHHMAKGWKKAEITKLVNGKANRPPDDPFKDVKGAIFTYKC